MNPGQIHLIYKATRLGQLVGAFGTLGGTAILLRSRKMRYGPKRTAMHTAGLATLAYGLVQGGGATLVRWVLEQ